MSAVNVVYLPGLFGSRLSLPPDFFGAVEDVWPPGLNLFTGTLLQLQLGPDGLSPGPRTFGKAMAVRGLVGFEYSPLAAFMRGRGWNVLEAAYDWRVSVLVSGAAVLSALQGAFGSNPIVFVGHSMGGLVARACYGLMVNAGLGGQVLGIVTLGTPHFGSWDAVRGFFGLPQLYQALASGCGIFGLLFPGSRVPYLDAILASWPGWYELLPWRDSGPLATKDPATAQLLYQLSTYSSGNPFIVAGWLAAAVQTQHFLTPAIPFQRIVCIRGVNYRTPFELTPGVGLVTDAGYQYTGGGDGQVPSDYATVATAANVDRQVSHADLPRDTRIWPAVVWAVQSLVGPGA